ncbi:MAG: MBOAT family O-acyltransferase, partial [Acidimicrobiales bacterium]
MLFPTVTFAFFFLTVLPVSWLLMPHRVRWRLFMIVASFVFYGAWSWRYVPLLALSIVGNHAMAMAVDRTPGVHARRFASGVEVAANLAVL